VTNEQDRPLDLLEQLLRTLGIVVQGRQGILDGVQRVVAALVQLHDDLGPVGRATPKAMNKHDARLVAHCGLLVPWLGAPLA
jgi:hypothetical protein